MKARPVPTPNPDQVNVAWGHGDRLDTLERKRDADDQFLRERCFIVATGGYAPPPIPPTPPTYEQSGGYTIATYTSEIGQFDPTGLNAVELFIVSGGGSGSPSYSYGEPGGGGGGGAVVYYPAYDVSGLTAPVDVFVGAGGTGGNRGRSSGFGALTIIGGGGGGSTHPPGQANGSSGGGAYSTRTGAPGTGVPGLGNPGGTGMWNAAGGGGGAHQPPEGVGGNGSASTGTTITTYAGNGGAGVTSGIGGTFLTYGAGGGAAFHPYYFTTGGDAYDDVRVDANHVRGAGGGNGAKLLQGRDRGLISGFEADDGQPTTGGGGGGGCSLYDGTWRGRPGDGGSGVVIVKWFGSPP